MEDSLIVSLCEIVTYLTSVYIRLSEKITSLEPPFIHVVATNGVSPCVPTHPYRSSRDESLAPFGVSEILLAWRNELGK